MQGSDLGGISAVHLAKFGFDERMGELGLTQVGTLSLLSSPDYPRDAPTRKRMPLPRNRFRHSGAALQCGDPGPAQPQGGGAAPSSRTRLWEPLPAPSLPRRRRRRRQQRPERGAGEGAEPERSGEIGRAHV